MTISLGRAGSPIYGNAFDLASRLFNLALAQAQHGEWPQALSSTREAAQLFTRLGRTEYAQRAQ